MVRHGVTPSPVTARSCGVVMEDSDLCSHVWSRIECSLVKQDAVVPMIDPYRQNNMQRTADRFNRMLPPILVVDPSGSTGTSLPSSRVLPNTCKNQCLHEVGA